MNKKKVHKDVKKFTVKRSKWLRGQGPDDSKLLNDAGQMCCLGFYARACGLSDDDIKNRPAPADVVRHSNKAWKSRLITQDDAPVNTGACHSLMAENDDENLKDTDREKSLKVMFKELGITVNFED